VTAQAIPFTVQQNDPFSPTFSPHKMLHLQNHCFTAVSNTTFLLQALMKSDLRDAVTEPNENI